jgi:hypothetical protein
MHEIYAKYLQRDYSGVHLTLFVQCFSLLTQRRPNGKRDWPILVYVCVIFTLGTVGFGGQVKFDELTFIQNRNFPGGPLAYNLLMYNEKVNVMSNCIVSRLFFPVVSKLN